MRSIGGALLVAVLLRIAGTLSVVYGIAAVSNAHFFNNTQYLFSSLHTWGWITIIVGVIHTAGLSLLLIGGAPVVVVGYLRPLHLRPARPDGLR